MTSPFEESLRTLDGVGKECRVDLQSVFVNTQAEADIFTAELLRSAQAVIDGIKAKLPPPARATRRRHRYPRNLRKELHPKAKKSFKKAQSRRSAGREVSNPIRHNEAEHKTVSNSVKESSANDKPEETDGLRRETDGLRRGTEANLHPSDDPNVEKVNIRPLNSPQRSQLDITSTTETQVDNPMKVITKSSDIARESGNNTSLGVETPSNDGSPGFQPERALERIPERESIEVQEKTLESDAIQEKEFQLPQSPQRTEQRDEEQPKYAESKHQAVQSRRSSGSTSSFYSAIDEFESTALKSSKVDVQGVQLLSATIEQKATAKETQKDIEGPRTEMETSTATKPSEDIHEKCPPSHEETTQGTKSPSPNPTVEKCRQVRKSSTLERTEKSNTKYQLPGIQASKTNSAAKGIRRSASRGLSSSEGASPPVSLHGGLSDTLGHSASRLDPTPLLEAKEASSADELQQPETHPREAEIRHHSPTHHLSPPDSQAVADINSDGMELERVSSPEARFLRKRPRQPSSTDAICSEPIVSLRGHSEDVIFPDSSSSQDSVERKPMVQTRPHFKESGTKKTHSTQQKGESDESLESLPTQHAVSGAEKIHSSNVKPSTDRMNIRTGKCAAYPTTQTKSFGSEPNSLLNASEKKPSSESHLESPIKTKAKSEMSPMFPVPKASMAASKRIRVDRDGKLDQESLGMLSKVATIGVDTASEKETPSRETPSEQLQTLRTTRLFNPNNNIYALSKPGASNSVQQYTASSRSSILSHTPGAQLPFKPVSNETSFEVNLASLNERVELLKKGQPEESRSRHSRSGEEVNTATGLRNDKDHRNAMDSVQRRVLTFAEKPVNAERPMTQPLREKQWSRFNAKPKSALRARMEEIMTGKSSNIISTPNVSSAATVPSFSHSVLPTYEKSKPLLEALKTDTSDDANPPGRRPSHQEPSNELKNGTGGGYENVSAPVGQSATKTVPASRIPASRQTRNTTQESMNDDKHQDQSVLPAENEEEQGRGGSGEPTDFEEAERQDKKAPLGNLMTSITSFIPGASSFLGSRPMRDRSEEESEAEAAAKRQKLDMERREAELQARREAQRLLKQKETEEKQRRAEKRRMMLARAEKEKEEERRRKEERRLKKKLEEEELRKKKKQEEDRKKEERRRQVLEKRAQNQAKQKRAKKGLETGGVRKLVKDGPSRAAGAHIGSEDQAHGEDMEQCVGGEKGAGGPLQTPVRKKADSNIGPSTYVMTPAQETVLEHSDEEEERRKHKQIPRWAQGRKLSTAARAQPDPDDVFVNVPTCDLREVFGNARRFRARTSSANWTRDRVTSQEMMRFRKGQAAFNDEKG